MSWAYAVLALACTLQTCATKETITSQDLKSMPPEQLFETAVKVRLVNSQLVIAVSATKTRPKLRILLYLEMRDS